MILTETQIQKRGTTSSHPRKSFFFFKLSRVQLSSGIGEILTLPRESIFLFTPPLQSHYKASSRCRRSSPSVRRRSQDSGSKMCTLYLLFAQVKSLFRSHDSRAVILIYDAVWDNEVKRVAISRPLIHAKASAGIKEAKIQKIIWASGMAVSPVSALPALSGCSTVFCRQTSLDFSSLVRHSRRGSRNIRFGRIFWKALIPWHSE